MLFALQEIVTSKKWLGVLLGTVVLILGFYNVIPLDLAKLIAGGLGVGVAAQAVADHGKSAEIVKAGAAAEDSDRWSSVIESVQPLIAQLVGRSDTAHAEAYHTLLGDIHDLLDKYMRPRSSPPTASDFLKLLEELDGIAHNRPTTSAASPVPPPAPSTPAEA